jgi:hypothetical protein
LSGGVRLHRPVDNCGSCDTLKEVGPAVPKVEPIGPWQPSEALPIILAVSDRGLHSIADDLSETWLEDWIGAGIAEIEAYLAKHAAFLAFLEARETAA